LISCCIMSLLAVLFDGSCKHCCQFKTNATKAERQYSGELHRSLDKINSADVVTVALQRRVVC
jgi:hypothetical protein